MEQRKQEEYAEENWMQITFAAKSENEGFARTAVAAFVSSLDPTIEELADIKTAVSEAVTNCIIHGYNQRGGTIWMAGTLTGRKLRVSITDEGRGIKDIKQALEPLFTTRPDLERSGMGFSFMEAFMDTVEVESTPGKGTRFLWKKKSGSYIWSRCWSILSARTRGIKQHGICWYRTIWDWSGALSGDFPTADTIRRICFRWGASVC